MKKTKKKIIVSDPSQKWKLALMILALLGASYVSVRVIGLLLEIKNLLQYKI